MSVLSASAFHIVQYHNSMEARNKAASLGLPVMEFDAAGEFWAADLDSALSVFQDPEYLKLVLLGGQIRYTRRCQVHVRLRGPQDGLHLGSNWKGRLNSPTKTTFLAKDWQQRNVSR
ncbi:unnamed protein product [Calypogeia fissa]